MFYIVKFTFLFYKLKFIQNSKDNVSQIIIFLYLFAVWLKININLQTSHKANYYLIFAELQIDKHSESKNINYFCNKIKLFIFRLKKIL